MGINRTPPEDSINLYPGLEVHDGAVGGSILIGASRLPMWSIIGTAITDGWDEVEDSWNPGEHNWTVDDTADFLYNLMEMRGEFGRLLLVLANAFRVQSEGRVQMMKLHAEGQPEPIEEPMWYEIPEIRAQVCEQLRRCLEKLQD